MKNNNVALAGKSDIVLSTEGEKGFRSPIAWNSTSALALSFHRF